MYSFIFAKRLLTMMALIVVMTASPAPGQQISYVYDDLSRLIRVEYEGGTEIDYVYDALGNRLTETVTPPGQPSNSAPTISAQSLQPPDGATGTGAKVTLSWEASDPDPTHALFYDIYFGKSQDPPLVKSGHSATSFDPGPLEFNTTCYWKIVVRDNRNASAETKVVSFSTGDDQPHKWVEPGGTCGGHLPCFTLIQDGIDAVVSAATVFVGAGTYAENIIIGANVTLEICWDATFSTTSHGNPVILEGP